MPYFKVFFEIISLATLQQYNCTSQLSPNPVTLSEGYVIQTQINQNGLVVSSIQVWNKSVNKCPNAGQCLIIWCQVRFSPLNIIVQSTFSVNLNRPTGCDIILNSTQFDTEICKKMSAQFYFFSYNCDFEGSWSSKLISKCKPMLKSRKNHIQRVLSHKFDKVCLLVGCLTSQQQASVSQGRICSDNLTCCHTETEVANPTFYLTQSQYTDTGLTSPSADPIMPGAWQGSHWSANFLSHWYDLTPKKSRRKRDSNPGPSALEADVLTTRPTRRSFDKERSSDYLKNILNFIQNDLELCQITGTEVFGSSNPCEWTLRSLRLVSKWRV